MWQFNKASEQCDVISTSVTWPVAPSGDSVIVRSRLIVVSVLAACLYDRRILGTFYTRSFHPTEDEQRLISTMNVVRRRHAFHSKVLMQWINNVIKSCFQLSRLRADKPSNLRRTFVIIISLRWRHQCSLNAVSKTRSAWLTYRATWSHNDRLFAPLMKRKRC